ncbi:MAG: hypothetical protein ACO3YQ_03455 [Flavobacteriales bacterium]
MHGWRIWALNAVVAASFLARVGPQAHAQFYDGSNTQYGKNRLQHKDFFWQFYPAGDVNVYHYQGGAELARRVVRILPAIRAEVEQAFDRTIEGPLEILVFASILDFRQSNIGMTAPDGGNSNIGGTARLVGNTLFLYAEGTSEQVVTALRSGLTRVLVNQTLYGGDLQDALRNASQSDYPAWFIEGLCAYVGNPWSAETRIYTVDMAASGRFGRLSTLTGIEAMYAGHAVWKYIADLYGQATLTNVLFMSRISRSVDSGVLYALGMSMEQLVSEVETYHLEGASLAQRVRVPKRLGELPARIPRRLEGVRASLQPSGKYVVYATDDRGQISVWLTDLETSTTRRIGRHGHRLDRIQDGGSPLFAWHPNGKQLLYSVERSGELALITYDIPSGDRAERPILRMDRLLSMVYSPDGNTIVFSGLRNGKSDLYRMSSLGNIHVALWEDDWDDLDPHFSADGSTLYFASNRPDTGTGDDAAPFHERPNHAIFSLAWNGRRDDLTQHTTTPEYDVRWPQDAGTGRFIACASAGDGSQELWTGVRDSAIAFIDTTIHYRFFTTVDRVLQLEQAIRGFEFAPETDLLALTGQAGSRMHWSRQTLEASSSNGSIGSPSAGGVEWDELGLAWDWVPGPGQVDIRRYVFGKAPEPAPAADEQRQAIQDSVFTLPTPRPYRLNYALESLTSQVANTFGGAFYQPYNGTVQVQPGLGALTSISMTDVFEDKRFTAGFRLAGSLENSLFGLAFSDYSRRWDRTVALERQGIQAISTDGFSLEETHIHTLRYRLTYPFDEVRSVRIEGFSRLDRTTPLATDAWNLAQPNSFAASTGVTVAYVLDTSRDIALNLWEGAKVRSWAEYFIDPSEPKGAGFGTAGIDARWSRRLFSTATCAVRFAANASWGGQRLLHVLGGVDNVLSLTANAGTPIDPGVAYAYQTRFTPMRGFRTNARNGAHAAVVNAEVRVPVLSSWVKRPLTSDFARHLQAVGFFDAGSAWNGLHPYADENEFNRVTVTRDPITVTIDNNREPILAGTGFGLRSKVLGYWMRADWSWGIDDGRWQDRVFSLSFHLDF